MILTKEIEVSITPRNITYYRALGYKVVFGSKINIPVEHLSKSSKLKIKCKCELCGTEGELIYEKYLINFNRHNFYSCKKCSNKKRILTSNEKYGVDNYSQTEEYKEKVINTNMEKYGVKSTLLNPETQEKIKKTNIERYGTEHPLQSQEVRNKGRETFLEKYGVDHYSKSDVFKNHMSSIWQEKTIDVLSAINKKAKATSIEKYGVDSFSKTEEFIEKCKITNNANFGVDFILLSDQKKEEIKKTNIERYGVDHYSKTEEFKSKIISGDIFGNYADNKEKIINTNIKKYGVSSFSKTTEFRKTQSDFFKSDDFKNKSIHTLTNNRISEMRKRLNGYTVHDLETGGMYVLECPKNHTFKCIYSLIYNRIRYNVEPCPVCNPINTGVSGAELKIIEFIKENYSGEIVEGNRKILNGKELDVYLPDLNIAIEYNGLYWHSEAIKENYYHYNKTVECEKLGIQLIHIYEDEWNYKQDIVKSRLLNILKKTPETFYARKCEVIVLSNKQSKDFLIANHIQGNVNAKISLGLLFQGKTVALMSFGNKRRNLGSKAAEGEYELLRFCNMLNTSVIGGASKLLKYFISNYSPSEIISYADRSWSVGGLYNKLGFELDSYTKPNYFYIDGSVRLNRFNFRKDILVSQGFDKSKTEHQIMLERGYLRIYNSGNIKFKLMCS